MIPAATALNLIPWVACSIASALVTAFRPPFVRIGRDADRPAIGWSARLVLIVTTCVEGVAILTGGFGGTPSSRAFNPLLTAGALAPWIAIGMVGTTLLIAVLARAALKGERASAVQSATGFFYLSLVTAFTAEIAVKTRFFPT